MTGLEGPVIGALISGVLSPIVTCVLQKIEKDDDLVRSLHKELNEALEGLRAQLQGPEEQNCNEAAASDVYLYWTKLVSQMENQLESLSSKYETWEMKPQVFWIYKGGLKNKIKRALKDVTKLIKLRPPPRNLVDHHGPPERVIPELGVRSIDDYRTLEKALEKVQQLLKEENVRCVALLGKKGVGKTTIMQHLNNNHYFKHSSNNNKESFDIVIFIKVAADEQIEKAADERTEYLYILHKIADRVKVDKEGVVSDEVARRILTKLKDKRYLLILDGITSRASGILETFALAEFTKRKNSKVVIITHSDHFASMKKYVDRKAELGLLTSKEAWNMFYDITCDNLLIQEDIANARRVCKFCYHLPLLIHHIANCLQQEARSGYWKNNLDKLMTLPNGKVQGLRELYQQMKICYYLLSPSKKNCFLYASQYPANSNIYTNYLVECCIVQDFFSGVRANRSKVVNILRDLISISLLEEEEQMRYVKMNHFYSQFTAFILSKDSKTCLDIVNHEERHAKWFSRIDSDTQDPPPIPHFVSLESLLLQKNLKLVQFSADYFKIMGNLVVLNLYSTNISKLPSLEGLTKLKALYLNGCSELTVDKTDEIKLLKCICLEVLDLRDAKMKFVPCIESLWCLRISYMALGDYRGISRLQKLEELTIEVKFGGSKEWFKNAKCIIAVVASLKNLKTLRYSFYFSKIISEVFKKTSELFMDKMMSKGSLPFKKKQVAINKMVPQAGVCSPIFCHMICELINE